MDTIPVVDLAQYLRTGQDAEACKAIAGSFFQFGLVIVRDPRTSTDDNNNFLDLMESYFNQPTEEKNEDVRADLHYQLGATPELTEHPRDHCEAIYLMPEENRAHKPKGADPKWRFFWRIGERPQQTEFPELNAAPVVPKSYPQWPNVMNTFGDHLLSAVNTVAEMAAVGFDLPSKTTFTDYLKMGPHLLAPTGSDLAKYNSLGQIFAGYHYDLNFITIHGKSRFAGLFVWTRSGQRMAVKVPEGCLLLQAGKQFEWLTGGRVLAGFHEVIVTPQTHEGIERARAEGRPLWRVSSTLFSHVASDKQLEVLPPFVADDPTQLRSQSAKWPSMKAGEQVAAELDAIKLRASDESTHGQMKAEARKVMESELATAQ